MMAIITPYYGKSGDQRFVTRKRYLHQTIQSVKSQDIDLIHIIVDDGSDDGAIDEITKKFGDSDKITIIGRERKQEDRLTCTNAINYGLQKILGFEKFSHIDSKRIEYVTILHSDDLAINLEARVNEMSKKSIDFLYTDAIILIESTKEKILWEGIDGSAREVRRNLWHRGRMPYPTMTWTAPFLVQMQRYVRDRYKRAFILDRSIGCGEDVDLALTSLELAEKEKMKIGYLREITAVYRIHDLSLAKIRNSRERREEENHVLKKHFGSVGKKVQHLERLINRPECYFPFLMRYVLSRRKKINLEDLERWLKEIGT